VLLLAAFARFRQSEPKAFLVLIGPETQPSYAARLRELVATHGMERQVRILPGMRNDQPELVQAFHAANVFVLPSMHEPFGIVVLEAWSAGRAVIASRVGGLQALVRDGETGLFLDPNAPTAAADLAAQLARLAGDPAFCTALGEAGRREARAHYDWTQIGQQLENLYQRAEQHRAQHA